MMSRFTADISFVTILALLFGCGSPKLEDTGGNENENPHVKMAEKVSIAYLKSLYSTKTISINEEIRIEGRIISSDAQGNFYNTLCIEDETGGIAIRISNSELFKEYLYGHMISIYCNSLALGTYGGLIQLGEYPALPATGVDPLSGTATQSALHLISGSGREPVPTTIDLAKPEPRYLSCYVRINDVRFVEEEYGLDWCDEGMDTDRHITNGLGDTLIVRTSRYANFANSPIPESKGTIRGILSYFNRNYQVIVFDIRDVEMD